MESTIEAQFHYPRPVELAEKKAQKEQIRLWPSLSVSDDPELVARAYTEICSYWGRMGGISTLERYGSEWYRTLALVRNGTLTQEQGAERRAALQYAYQQRLTGGGPTQ